MPRIKALAAGLFILLILLYVAFSYLNDYLADVVKSSLEREVRACSGLNLHLGVVEVSALRGDILAFGLRVIDPTGSRIVALAQRLTIDADPFSLLRKRPVLERLDLWKLELALKAPDVSRLLQALSDLPGRAAYPQLRIGRIDVYLEECVIEHELIEGKTVMWRAHPGEISVGMINLSSPPGQRIPVSFTVRLVEPSSGRVRGRFLLSEKETEWVVSGKKEVEIDRLAGLSPYLPDDFPVVPLDGSLRVSADVVVTGAVVSATATVTLFEPEFEPREDVLNGLFAGQEIPAVIRAIREATGEITLDPISISGVFPVGKREPSEQFLNQFSTNLLRKVLRSTYPSL